MYIQTVTEAMSELDPPVSLGSPESEEHLRYLWSDEVTRKDYDYPEVVYTVTSMQTHRERERETERERTWLVLFVCIIYKWWFIACRNSLRLWQRFGVTLGSRRASLGPTSTS